MSDWGHEALPPSSAKEYLAPMMLPRSDVLWEVARKRGIWCVCVEVTKETN